MLVSFSPLTSLAVTSASGWSASVSLDSSSNQSSEQLGIYVLTITAQNTDDLAKIQTAKSVVATFPSQFVINQAEASSCTAVDGFGTDVVPCRLIGENQVSFDIEERKDDETRLTVKVAGIKNPEVDKVQGVVSFKFVRLFIKFFSP